MTPEEARASIGQMVMTTDGGAKMIRYGCAHGPYLLKQVTKGGLCILEGFEYQVPPSTIKIIDNVK